MQIPPQNRTNREITDTSIEEIQKERPAKCRRLESSNAQSITNPEDMDMASSVRGKAGRTSRYVKGLHWIVDARRTHLIAEIVQKLSETPFCAVVVL